jgi:hypothetical protein
MDISLDGWSIGRAAEADWAPWGGSDLARAKVLGTGDGFLLALVEAKAGYRGTPHEHEHTELFHLQRGTVRNQGEVMTAGDGYVAAAGSTHADFEVLDDATYLSIFRL